HDIDDAIRAGILTVSDLPSRTNKVLGETSSSRIDAMVGSLVETSLSADAVEMGKEVFEVLLETRSFMFDNVYERPEMKPEHDRTRALLRALIDHFAANPDEIPGQGDAETRLIDYVAGMTDRFAQREYDRLIGKG
ncbi:MAG: deoxyguanosinetriphosphate triphosphohydrolase, partial [Actinomycetota bacterium]